MNYYLIRVLLFVAVILLIIVSMFVFSIIWRLLKPSESTKIKTGKILFVIYSILIVSTLCFILYSEFDKKLLFNSIDESVHYSYPSKKILNKYEMSNSAFVLLYSDKWSDVIEVQKQGDKWRYIVKETESYKKNKFNNDLGYYIVMKSNYSDEYLIRFYFLKEKYDSVNFKDNFDSVLIDSALNNVKESKYSFYVLKYLVINKQNDNYSFIINDKEYFIND